MDAGTTYSEFIKMMHLPSQLAHVDPIVASFCGGAVGVLSAFMVVEANNAKAQEKRRCQYCEVTLLYLSELLSVTVSTRYVLMSLWMHVSTSWECNAFVCCLTCLPAIWRVCQRLCTIAQAWLCKLSSPCCHAWKSKECAVTGMSMRAGPLQCFVHACVPGTL